MKLSLDTSVIVDIDRGKRDVIEVLDRALEEHTVFVSCVVASEIFTGTHLQKDHRRGTRKARELFSKFEMVPLDMEIAEMAGEISAFLISEGRPIEYQDVAIAATFLHRQGDYLLTENREHFERIPKLEGKVLYPVDLQL
ncbi:MAG: type II toxin-antitoxin system VapC family toxin [Euryarchaeota archaeon]|nr:type II toxin-antitoxin system VapC family toxin [Euryarchaeota archaeon]